MSNKRKDHNESPNGKGGKGGKGRRSGSESPNKKSGRRGSESSNHKRHGGSESSNGKGRGGYESPNGNGPGNIESPNWNGLGSNGDLGSLLEKKLRKKANGTSTPVAGAADANGTGIGGAVEALRAILDPGLSRKKSKKTCKKSKKCHNDSESCWE